MTTQLLTEMDLKKIDNAVQRLERNLPIRHRQTQLPEPLRQLHQSILRYYLEHGVAPGAADLGEVIASQQAIGRLGAEHIVVIDDSGAIAGAYPFTSEAREFCVTTSYGQVNAMCAFDALAVSSMFAVPVRIDSRCHLSGQAIVIEQNGADIRVVEPAVRVFAAINWDAAAGAGSCSATLCSEMIFIVGEEPAYNWRGAQDDNRELFDLGEAQVFISAVFEPLMQ